MYLREYLCIEVKTETTRIWYNPGYGMLTLKLSISKLWSFIFFGLFYNWYHSRVLVEVAQRRSWGGTWTKYWKNGNGIQNWSILMNLIEFPYFLYVENQIAEQHRLNKFSKDCPWKVSLLTDETNYRLTTDETNYLRRHLKNDLKTD